MKSIEIDREVYEYLRQKAELGESANSVLKRELKLTSASRVDFNETTSEVGAFLQDPHFLTQRESTGRFLAALGWIHSKKRESFHIVLGIKGRSRLYFAESSKDLEESGSSMQPHKIPGSRYWVVTNNDTPKKERILMEVMRLLGYSSMDSLKMANGIKG